MTNFCNFKNRGDLPTDFEVIDSFSLKYLAKFVTEYQIREMCVYGGALPIQDIQADRITQLCLRDQGLYS